MNYFFVTQKWKVFVLVVNFVTRSMLKSKLSLKIILYKSKRMCPTKGFKKVYEAKNLSKR